MIRFIGVCITVIGYLIFSIPEFGYLWLVGKFSVEKRDRLALASVQKRFRSVLKISGVDLTVIGTERIPEGAVLFVPNHRSQFDILLTYVGMKNLTGFIAKKEMEKIPLLNTRMKYLHCLFLDRHNPREGMKTIQDAINLIKKGISVCIFPEGTRNKGDEGTLLEFKEGSFRIADKGECPIVPIAISNAQAIFERQFPRIVRAQVIMEYCAPIYPSTLERADKKRLGAICSSIIKEKLATNNKLITRP